MSNSQFPVEFSVLYRFGQVVGGDVLASFQVGDCPGDAEDLALAIKARLVEP